MKPSKTVNILFDESHSESWSVSAERAAEIQPEFPAHSSYQMAADALSRCNFMLQRNLDQPLPKKLLDPIDILALIHPSDAKWEKTTSPRSPILSPQEIKDIHSFVQDGGSLLVISEYEHDKYGNNLNDLLTPFGLGMNNTCVMDRVQCHQNPTWILGEPAASEFAYLCPRACFYLSGTCRVSGNARTIWRASEHATPRHGGLIATSQYGKGRVVLVADSSLFGDEHFQEFDHTQLWLNLLYWCAVPSFQRRPVIFPASAAATSPAWMLLKEEVHTLRRLQNKDGSIELQHHSAAGASIAAILARLESLQLFFPHQLDYLKKTAEDLHRWMQSKWVKPDFGASLAAFNPQLNRTDGREHIVLFPMYTPNASMETRLEALIIRTPWPSWLSELEQTHYRNNKFVPGQLVDFTEGYQSECAVLFPETISLSQRPSNSFGIIFSDRETRRLQLFAQKAAAIVQLELHPRLEAWLACEPIILDTLMLWDLIHDKSHSLGELPFDPFMIRQRAPFWMYGIEELRVDLRSFEEALKLFRGGFSFAHNVTYAILLDRIFRFPISGTRIRNYDALGGQILFSFLHQKDILLWHENRLTIRWDLLPEGIHELRGYFEKLYKLGSESSKMSFWIAAHDLISTWVHPNLASKWKKEGRTITDEKNISHWLSLIEEDEFPLGTFHLYLQRQMYHPS